MDSQVTTKRGDAGTTVLMSGDRYPKSHPILECCGQLDAMRAQTALCRLSVKECAYVQREKGAEFLFWMLHSLFLVGSHCNDPEDKHPEYRHRDLAASDLEKLERYQAAFESKVTLPRQFIVTASSRASAELDVLCTQVRTFERSVVRLGEAVPAFKADLILAFANRLSDTVYMLARYLENGEHVPVDYSVLDD